MGNMLDGYSQDELSDLAQGRPMPGFPMTNGQARPAHVSDTVPADPEDNRQRLAVLSIRMGVIEEAFNKLIKLGGRTEGPPKGSKEAPHV